jgi:hydrogenase-4 component F
MTILFISILLLSAFGVSFFVKKSIAALSAIACAASGLELIAIAVIVARVVNEGSYALTEYFFADALGAVLLILLGIVGFAASWYSAGYLRAEVNKGVIGFRRVKQYFLLLHLFLLAMFVAVLTTNPILAWIAVEATTLSTAFLISFYHKPSAMEAAWKYLIISSLGLLFAFFGTVLFLFPAVHAGQDGLITWHTLLAAAAGSDPFLIKMAFIFVFIGYGTKAGLVPMHTWLPDAHSKAPVPISSLLSGVLLNVAFLEILRFKTVADAAVGSPFSQGLFIYFGLLSILVAAFTIFMQKTYKRLLAYSSIEHMGIIALGFGFGGAGAFAALLHMLYHALTKSILFLSAGNIFLKYSSTKMANVHGVLKVLPVTGSLFIIGFLAITGVPPFGIFLTELSILSAGIYAYPVVTATALMALALVFVGFLKHVLAMMFGEADSAVVRGESGYRTVAPVVLLAVILFAASVIVPPPIRDLFYAASAAY